MKKRWIWILAALLILAVVAVIGVAAGPGQLLARYPTDKLIDEMQTMNECADCHETDKFHACDTCHDDHGAIEMENVPFYAGITFQGDVPSPGYVLIDDILPYRDQPHTHIPLLDFLASQDVTSFESVTLTSLDGGFVTLTRENLTASALLMPYEDGIRFAAEDLHISAWIKGIRGMIVVGQETPLTIDGQPTSIGRLLTGPTGFVTVEETDVMFKSEDDGQVRKASSGTRIEGASITVIVANPDFTELIARDATGTEHTFTYQEAHNALVAQFRGHVTLVLPERGRSQWIADVIEIQSH